MAEIIENKKGRRLIRVSTNDIISIVQEYQNIIQNERNYSSIRNKLNNSNIYLPEDI